MQVEVSARNPQFQNALTAETQGKEVEIDPSREERLVRINLYYYQQNNLC